jgi:hypothetical protein
MPSSKPQVFFRITPWLFALTLCFVCSAPVVAKDNNDKNNPPVIINAANGNSHTVVQAALDAYPKNTTFQLIGTFVFADNVHIEKSGTQILGDWIDTNANGQPDEDDIWNTVITATPNIFGASEGFQLIPSDEVNSSGYDVSGIEISGIHFSGINLPVAVLPFPHPGQGACRSEPLPYHLSDLLLQNNWFEGGSLYIYRSVDHATIDNNLITLFGGRELYTHGIEMRGATAAECGMPPGLEVRSQNELSITNNTFTGGRDISVGFQNNLEVSGNVMTGYLPYPSFKLWLSQASSAKIANNIFEAGATNSGVLFWSKSFWPGPEDLYSDKVEFIGNEFIDTASGIRILGGTDNTSIRNNRFYRTGEFGPTGFSPLELSDVASQLANDEIVARSSENVTITDNDIAGGGLAGIVVNGETSGLEIANNVFDNPSAEFGDVLLAPEDVVFGWGDLLCPAQDNKVSAIKSEPTVVSDGYSPRCEGSRPNNLSGKGITELVP